jgi:hypothetical protein
MISIIMGLSLARLLNGVAGLIQHPKKEHLWWPHLCWVLYMMVSITAFWWWQFQLTELRALTFETYIFLISEAAMLFLLCSVIFPTEISEYDGYGDYFMSRRAWFFGLLIVSLLMDVLDTLLKGAPHFLSLGPEYPDPDRPDDRPVPDRLLRPQPALPRPLRRRRADLFRRLCRPPLRPYPVAAHPEIPAWIAPTTR